MVYFSIESAVQEYLKRYEISEAIAQAQKSKHQSLSKARHDFWCAVEIALKELKPKRESKAKWLKSKEV